jgi:branched-chain amino acid transport system ATP-binding protein
MSQDLLTITNLVKHFGALKATDHVDLDVRAGEVHALIGPNGAGKTTLINQIGGELRPDEGQIYFKGRDITHLPIHKRAAGGLGRTFQVTNIFNSFDALGNVALAVQAHTGHSFRFWRPAKRDKTRQQPAMEMLKLVGLEQRARTPVGRLSHGERRQVGIAMALAGQPDLLLLDEPTAGMGSKASAHMVELLARLKGRHALLLVEHDMDVVFSLANRISVLVYGQIIASGPPAEIRHDPTVRDAYLGAEEDV